ncbi:MAG: MarR family winged helix-turn-helix transcriptional regulator, partial [Flavobacteriales bacterium]
MRLEDEINQKQFNSESHKLAVNLIYTYNWLNSLHSAFLKEYGVTMQQYNVLRILRGMNGKPANVKTVRDRMLDKMSDASRIIEKLRGKGWARRSTCVGDRRACDVLITPEGLALLEK